MTNKINLDDPALKEFTKFAQIIPKEMMDEIKQAAAHKGVSVDLEVATRLLATMIEPQTFGLSDQMQRLLAKKIEESQAKIENEMRRRGWKYIYEMSKLKLFVDFEDKLPKKFKESFEMIDVEKEIKILREEKARKDQENKGE